LNESVLEVGRNLLVGAGLVVALGCLARGLPARVALGAGLEFWIAGGLLNLSSAIISWQAIATVVTIIALRKVLIMALPHPPRLPP
jgi:hypothetical protein